MVRNKNIPSHQPLTSAEAEEMANCKRCELALNRKGESRPGIRCKDCKTEHCAKCAELTNEFCESVRKLGKDVWCCGECEGKTAVMKTVIDKIETLHTEMVNIKKGQEGQQAEQERVLESIKVVETVVKRMEVIEKTQTDHGERLLEQEANTRKNIEKIEETEKRTEAIEKRLAGMDGETVSVKVTNAVVRELREMEKNDRNLVIANIPESLAEEAEVRKREDEKKVCAVFSELNYEQIKPANVICVGFGGRYLKKILVIFRTKEDKEKILESAEKTTLSNNVWLARSRTWNQREEARLFREEKRKEEEEGVVTQTQRGRPRGSGKGPGRPKKSVGGSVRGRGSRQEESLSRKRRISGENDEAKWRRTGAIGRGRGRGISRGGGRGGGVATGGGGETSTSPSRSLAHGVWSREFG